MHSYGQDSTKCQNIHLVTCEQHNTYLITKGQHSIREDFRLPLMDCCWCFGKTNGHIEQKQQEGQKQSKEKHSVKVV